MDRSYRPLPLNPMRTFAIASRHRSFTDAAKEIGVSQVAISRQVAILEDYLGVKLFERGSRSVKLTDVGRSFGHEIAILFDDLERATERIHEGDRSATVNLRVYPTFAHHWLLPRLAGFTERHPGARVHLDTAVEPLDFRGTHLDVAIQLGHGGFRDARSRKLFDEVVDVVASPRYAARLSDTAPPDGLAGCELLHGKYRRRVWEMWARETGYDIAGCPSTDFETSLLVYRAASQGFGLAVAQIGLLETEIRSGEIVRPLDRPVATGAAFHVVWPTMKSVSTTTRHFVDWLLETCGEAPEFFTGRSAPG